MRQVPRTLPTFGIAVATALAAGIALGVGANPTQQAKLEAPGTASSTYVGNSVAVSGNTVLVGAPGADGNRGAAHVFRRTGTTWDREKLFENWQGKSGERFGYSVALSGDTGIVGLRGANEFAGAVDVFTRTGTTWNGPTRLVGTDTAVNDQFGYSVALQGDTAAVGALWNASQRGAVYIFTRSGTDWTQSAKLTASDAMDNDGLGNSVAIAGDTLVAGAYSANGYVGAAYVFVRSGAQWTQQAKLTASDGAVNDTFGRSVAVSGDTVIVGTEARDSHRGGAYVFRRTGTDWTQEAQLALANGADNDYFGYTVAISGGKAVVGAYGRNSRRGAAYVFERTDAGWVQTAELVAADPVVDDQFGFSSSMSGDTLVVGAYGKDFYEGAAYVFTGFLPPSGYCLPAKVSAKANAKHAERSTLTASGTLDTGSAEPDFSGAATLDVGGFHLDIPAFVAKGRSLTYSAGGISLKVTPPAAGSSRAAFSVKAVGDLSGKVDRDGALEFRLANAAHDLYGRATLTKGSLGPHCLASPDLCVLSAAATIKGSGKDTLKLTLGFVTDGVVPAAAEDVTIGFGGKFASGVLPASSFVRKRNAWVRTAKAPGITSVSVDHAKGTISIAGSGLDLGAFTPGGNPVTVTITRGGDTRTATIRMARAGTKLGY